MPPVEYSELITMTPRTAIASWPSASPDMLVDTGSNLARSAADICGQPWFVPHEASTPRPMVAATRASKVQPVERTEKSLVNSARITRGSVLPGLVGSSRCCGDAVAEIGRASCRERVEIADG